MGWWKIDSVENGGIDWRWDSGSNNVSAVPGKHPVELEYGGDGPADVMSKAVDKIWEQYKKAWGRSPTRNELQACFNFVANPAFSPTLLEDE